MEIPRVIHWRQAALRGGSDLYFIRIFQDRLEYEYICAGGQYDPGRTVITPILLDNKRMTNITEERILMAIRLASVLGDSLQLMQGPNSHVKDWLIDFLTM